MTTQRGVTCSAQSDDIKYFPYTEFFSSDMILEEMNRYGWKQPQQSSSVLRPRASG